MKLYVLPPSPNSLCCQAVANQIGLELELIPLDFTKGEHLSEDFVAINPNHKIPTLVDGDYVLWESGAIMLYLARKQAGNDLIPEDLHERAKMMQWMFWNEAHWKATCSIFTFENIVKGMFGLGDPDPAQLARGEEDMKRYAAVLNDHLKGRATLVGDSLTPADHSMAAWLVHAEAAGISLDDYAEIARWSGEILGSDAWQAALATMQG